MQAESQVFLFILSITPNRQTNLQAQIAQKMENSRCFSYILARIEYHEEGASE